MIKKNGKGRNHVRILSYSVAYQMKNCNELRILQKRTDANFPIVHTYQ